MRLEYYIDVTRVRKYVKGVRVSRWWTRIKARNHKILWSSEIINTKRSAFKPVNDFVKNVGKTKCRVTYYDKINKTKEIV